ncbi:MAG: pyridoxamine 5'-phosphate oxidase family protein [Planctomycetes bacterium]|nr:pyridoxamine 5'-phosphate oxidase family protein [Planctomycetota bacterium]
MPTELAEFLQSGISILVGTRDARLTPEAARVLGARIENGGREVVAFLSKATAERTLANLRDNGRAAVCFTSVDHRSYQIKGRALEVRDADEDDRKLIERYRAAVAQHFGTVGLPPRLTYRMSYWPAHALRVAVEEVFIQTPGPGAGGPLGQPRRGLKS